jgi:hypothetical protein
MKMTDQQKLDRKVWSFIGYMTCVSIDKYLKTRLYYVRTPKSIRVEDLDNVMAYAPIVQADLDERNMGMTLKQLEDWLISKGLKRQPQKRVKRSYSLYD